MGELTIPKRRIAVEVRLAVGAERRVTLFLGEAAAGRAGGERLSDLLEGDATFLPAWDEGASAMTFLRRDALVLVRAPRPPDPPEADELTLPTEHEVEVTLGDGTLLRALAVYVLPPERSRLVDWLNGASRFLPLHAGDDLLLVNKAHVVRVVALEP